MAEPNLFRDTIFSIHHYISSLLADPNYDPHVSTLNHLNKLLAICNEVIDTEQVDSSKPEYDPKWVGVVVISCDASIKNNPGGPASCGVVVRYPQGNLRPMEIAKLLPKTTTNNQAEYDGVYESLNYLRSFVHIRRRNDFSAIEIRLDSQLVVNQLNGEYACNEPDLQRRKDIILEVKQELEKRLSIPITFQWYPRNSTDDMKRANYLAQDELGVSRH